MAITKIVEPKHYHEAVRRPEWRETMAVKIRALEANKTWVIEDLPPGKKSIGCKWFCRVKYNSDGTIQCSKGHLVIRGDHQVEGFAYNEILLMWPR